MTRFVKAYEKACPGQTLTYTSNGSGAGVSEFLGGKTDFGGSDSPLAGDEYGKATQRCGSQAWNLPTVFGPLAITYNLNAVETLVLDAATLAKIFNGTITRWNDPAITALNSSASLPAEPIHVVFRSDGSGTTDNFQQYLDAASGGAWSKGTGKTFNGGVGQGTPGNEGTSATGEKHRGRHHLQRMVLRPSTTPARRQDPHLGRTRSGGHHRRHRQQDHRQRHHHGPRQQPGARHHLVLQTHPARRLPDRAGHLPAGVLEILRFPGRHRGAGIPAVHRRPGTGRLGGLRILLAARPVPNESSRAPSTPSPDPDLTA